MVASNAVSNGFGFSVFQSEVMADNCVSPFNLM